MYDEEDDNFGRSVKTQLPESGQLEQSNPGNLEDASGEQSTTPLPPRRPTTMRAKPVPKPSTPIAQDEDESFFEKHKPKIVIAGIVILGAVGAFFIKPGNGSTASKAPQQMVSIKLPPLPPPPPPPPPKVQPPPPKEQKMEQQQPVAAEEKHEEAPKPKADAPQQTLGTGLKGDGPGLSGLGGTGNGGGFGGPSGSGGSKWGWYAGKVQSRVKDALHRNKTTKAASLSVQVRIWPDSTGHVQKAKLDGSTGDHNLDNALQNEVLSGLQLDPPPPGMPMPIVMRLTARRP